jgi:hypothetical protein
VAEPQASANTIKEKLCGKKEVMTGLYDAKGSDL